MRINLIKNIFFAFAILICCSFSSSSVFSQEKCDSRFDVYEFKESGDSENFPVENYNVKLVNAKTNKTVKTIKFGEKVIVKNVSKEDFVVTISKDGFQKTEIEFSPDCSLADAQNTSSQIVFLWKGDSKKTFKPYSKFPTGAQFGVVQKDSDSKEEVLNSGAIVLGKPKYPRAAKAVRASGKIEVQVLINELGNVVTAKAISGHPLLQSAAIEAAKESKFKMTLLSGIPVKVNGIIVYNFVP